MRLRSVAETNENFANSIEARGFLPSSFSIDDDCALPQQEGEIRWRRGKARAKRGRKERENELARALGLLFDQLDFRVTRIMILVAAAGSRIALDPHASILGVRLDGTKRESGKGIRETCQGRDREERLTFARAGSVDAKPKRLNSRRRKMQTSHAIDDRGVSVLSDLSQLFCACMRISIHSAAIRNANHPLMLLPC